MFRCVARSYIERMPTRGSSGDERHRHRFLMACRKHEADMTGVRCGTTLVSASCNAVCRYLDGRKQCRCSVPIYLQAVLPGPLPLEIVEGNARMAPTNQFIASGGRVGDETRMSLVVVSMSLFSSSRCSTVAGRKSSRAAPILRVRRPVPSQAVMVAAQAAALLLACCHQTRLWAEMLVRKLEICGQTHGMGSKPDLVRQFIEQAQVGGCEGLAGSARGEEQLADRCPLVDERQCQRLSLLVAVARGNGEFVILFEQDGSIR